MEIQLRRDIQLVGHVFPILSALTHTFASRYSILTVHRAEVGILFAQAARASRREFWRSGAGATVFSALPYQYRLPELTTGWASWLPAQNHQEIRYHCRLALIVGFHYQRLLVPGNSNT